MMIWQKDNVVEQEDIMMAQQDTVMAKLSQVLESIGNNDDSVYCYSNIETICGIIRNYDSKI